MLDEKKLREKIIDVGAYYSAQQVEVNPDELLEHEFAEEEVDFLRGKEVSYVEDIIREEYKPFTDLSGTLFKFHIVFKKNNSQFFHCLFSFAEFQ